MVTAYWSVTVFEVSASPHPPPPPLADVVCLQELHHVSEAEVRDWFRGSVVPFIGLFSFGFAWFFSFLRLCHLL